MVLKFMNYQLFFVREQEDGHISCYLQFSPGAIGLYRPAIQICCSEYDNSNTPWSLSCMRAGAVPPFFGISRPPHPRLSL